MAEWLAGCGSDLILLGVDATGVQRLTSISGCNQLLVHTFARVEAEPLARERTRCPASRPTKPAWSSERVSGSGSHPTACCSHVQNAPYDARSGMQTVHGRRLSHYLRESAGAGRPVETVFANTHPSEIRFYHHRPSHERRAEAMSRRVGGVTGGSFISE
jgi:hypothetical protein